MEIPKKFNLGGQTITVEWNDRLLHTDDCTGMAFYRDNKIQLQKPSKSKPIPRSKIEETFLHEKVHMVLSAMGEHELKANEKFVDLFATFWHQSLKTSSGKLPIRE